MTDKAPKWPEDFGDGTEYQYKFGKKEKIMMIAFGVLACFLLYNIIQINSQIDAIYTLDPNTSWNCKNLYNYTSLANFTAKIDPTNHKIPQSFFDQVNEKKAELGCSW